MVKQLMENVEKVKKTMSEENGNINKGIENLKKKTWKQMERWKSAIIKKFTERFKDRFEQAEERISKLEARTVEITETEEQKEKGLKKREKSPRDMWETIKWTNICIVGVLERTERKGKREYLKK